MNKTILKPDQTIGLRSHSDETVEDQQVSKLVRMLLRRQLKVGELCFECQYQDLIELT